MTTSTDPNKTRGSAAQGELSLRFPLTENPLYTTRLKFTQYTRFNPFDQPTEKTTALITLPLPMSIPDRSEINTSKPNMGAAFGLLTPEMVNRAVDIGKDGVVDGLKRAWDIGESMVTDQLKNMEQTFKVNGIKALALSPLVPDSWKDRLSVFSGVVANPHTNLIFEGVNLKSYTLTWRVSPRSVQESDMINEIKNTIKQRIHPEETLNGYALDYPDVVYITYTGEAAQYLPIHHKSMVTDFTVNSVEGEKYRSGAPIELELMMSVQEMAIITRNTLREEQENRLGIVT